MDGNLHISLEVGIFGRKGRKDSTICQGVDEVNFKVDGNLN